MPAFFIPGMWYVFLIHNADMKIKKEGIILEKTHHDFENDGVLNPAVIKVGSDVHMFYRAVRLGNFSTIGYCRFEGPLKLAERWEKPLLIPSEPNEHHGVEDARIVCIDDVYYMTYTAYDGKNALGALATGKDLFHFEKQGIIVPTITYQEFKHMVSASRGINEKYLGYDHFYQMPKRVTEKLLLWDKNVIFFPRRINGMLAFLHRIRPGIQLVMVNDLKELTGDFWIHYFFDFTHHIVMDPIYPHEINYLGGGCPPIETEAGWLVIYHGVYDVNTKHIYVACAALLDIDNPVKVIARLPYPLFSPEHDWELFGVVNNVVFPTGCAVFDDMLYIYYGAADSRISAVSLSMNELINELLTHKVK
jgi:predicted GH43/DUF377 family glycosyl hydrolase